MDPYSINSNLRNLKVCDLMVSPGCWNTNFIVSIFFADEAKGGSHVQSNKVMEIWKARVPNKIKIFL